MFDDFYGLSGRPFQLTPDPAFYFESLTHRKALSYLSYGIAQGEGFIVITGEVGAGKSTLVAHLMATIDRQRLTAAQVASGRLDGADMVVATAQAFGLRGPHTGYGDRAQVLGEIEFFLQEEARAGRRCLLVVDEVQTLSVAALEELRLLSNFQLGTRPLLQILLLGQPEFRAALQTHPDLEQLRQRVIASHHLEAMEPGEIEPYLLHRLRHVGWVGRPEFDPRLFAELYAATAGVPRRLNHIASRLMMLGAIEQRGRIDGVMLAHVLAELTTDGGLPLAVPAPRVAAQARPAPEPAPVPVAEAAPAVAAPGHAEPTHAGPADELAAIHAALADRDAQIAELQQAVIELANSHELPLPAAHEAALAEQAQAIDGHRAAINAHGTAIDDQRTAITVQRDQIADHGAALGRQAVTLGQQAAKIDGHAGLLDGQAAMLAALTARLEALEAAPRPDLTARIDALADRVDEMEQMLRHTLVMLTEWIEREEDLRAAA